jgi:hypothetical protein
MYVCICAYQISINGHKTRIIINTKKSLFSKVRQNFYIVCQYTFMYESDKITTDCRMVCHHSTNT